MRRRLASVSAPEYSGEVPKPKQPGSKRKPASASRAGASPVLVCLLFLFTALIVYWPCLNAPFLWDDEEMVRPASAGLQRIWTGRLVDFLPVTSTVFWAGWHLWGESPLGYRLLNVTLHAVNCFLVYRVLGKLRVPGSFLAAMLFCVHPVCVGTVAWIAELKNTLSLFFALLTVWFFLESRQTWSKTGTKEGTDAQTRSFISWKYLVAVTAFLFSLLSKVSVVMLPFFLLALCYRLQNAAGTQTASPCAPRQRIRDAVASVLITAPFFALSFVLGLVNIWFQRHHAMTIVSKAEYEPLINRLLSGGYALWFYLCKVLIPVHLLPIYLRWEIHASSSAAWAPAVLWLVLLGTCGALSLRSRALSPLRRASRVMFWGLSFFTVMLLPVLGLAQISYFYISKVADHLQYVPMLGVLTAEAFILVPHLFRPSLRVAQISAATLLILVFAFMSWDRARLFANPEQLWRHNLLQNPQAAMAWSNLGDCLKAKGLNDEAAEMYQKAVQIDPDNLPVRELLAEASVTVGRTEDALREYRIVARGERHNARVHNNIGSVLARKSMYNDAVPEFQAALGLSADFPEARKNLGAAYLRLGRYDEAIGELREVLRAHPDYPLADQLLQEALRQKAARAPSHDEK